MALEAGWAPDRLGTKGPPDHGGRRVPGGPLRERSRAARGRPARPAHVPLRLRGVRARGERPPEARLREQATCASRTSTSAGTSPSRIGLSPAIFGAPATTAFVRLRAAGGARLGESGFALAAASWETRLDAGAEERDRLGLARLRPQAEDEATSQTFVAKLRYDQGWNLDRDVQFIADGLVGLRGYRLYSFTGDKRAILNLEHRAFRGKEILNLFAPGVAFFARHGHGRAGGHAAAPVGVQDGSRAPRSPAGASGARRRGGRSRTRGGRPWRGSRATRARFSAALQRRDARQDRDERRPAPEREALAGAPAAPGPHAEEPRRFAGEDRLGPSRGPSRSARASGVRHREADVRQLDEADRRRPAAFPRESRGSPRRGPSASRGTSGARDRVAIRALLAPS